MKPKFNKSDFKGWKYEKIIGLSLRRKVLDLFPYLSKYPEFDKKIHDKNKKARLSHEKVLRYVMIMYTENILLHSIPELPKRKREAILLAGFEPNPETGKFLSEIEDMIACKIPYINAMIVRMVRLNRNGDFTQLCVFEEARANQMQKLLDGEIEKEKTKDLRDNIKNLSEDIDNLRSKILNEDEATDLIEALYDEIDNSNLGISPEDIAQARKDGSLKKVLKSPYKN